jgi:hypothetical protein
MIEEHATQIENLANDLLVKETLDLLDIIRILGDRPFPMSANMKDYMREIEMRKQDKTNIEENKAKEHKSEEEKEKDDKDKDDKDKEDKDDDKKSDEYDKDRDLRGKDKKDGGSGGRLPPKNPQERDIAEAETIMKESEKK